jgi:aryl-alcohol dehydrogenase-like predicted oxidoreductase
MNGGIAMNYRKFGRANIQVSEIGMGLEHLLDKDELTR